MSVPPLERSMKITISPNDYTDIHDAIIAGKADFSKITMEQYMNIAFLSLFSGDEIHNDLRVVHKGNVYQLHACISGIVPNQPVEQLKRCQ